LGLPKPTAMLGVGSGTHAEQTAALLTRFEPVLEQLQPHVVIVVGDVNSTMACALAAAKFRLRDEFTWALQASPRARPIVAHVEAGLRSGDNDMPEEINRRVTDAIADLLFTTEASATEHLAYEGVAAERVFFVGNVMIDSLLAVSAAPGADHIASQLGLASRQYAVVTLHRPSNVDDPVRLAALLQTISGALGGLPAVFPAHPRTRAALAEISRHSPLPVWHIIEPLGYAEFVGLLGNAALVCTDSGGVQEEATILATPCVTLRDTTERPITVTHGTNRLAGTALGPIGEIIRATLAAPRLAVAPPPLWDGQTAPRIINLLADLISA
ncbi:MAG: UDP-N-acetylglucosamine 2-epimerase (non-hydrolyzing), partial [Kofleriaceae bacterium]|nr:UDP-N-acetylglucosamine 2-epimerase (non-hydrolyzing) [Kofleriaceae bacterium]